MSKYYKEYRVDSFNQLIELTVPNGKLYNCRRDGYIFRGEASDKWKLIPSALREDISKKATYSDKLVVQYDKDEFPQIEAGVQIYHECKLLNLFYGMANSQGLKVPTIRSSLLNDPLHSIYEKEWYTEEYEELASLAQHYKIPTRMLDWTNDFMVAFYFAFNGRLKRQIAEKNLNDNITIWCMNRKIVDAYTRMKFVKPPYYANSNARAQSGILSFWPYIKEVDGDIMETEPIYELVRGELEKNQQEVFEMYESSDDYNEDQYRILKETQEEDKENAIIKIVISKEICINGIQWLNDLGYTTTRIFPGYYGIIKEIENEQLFRENMNIF